ncbi:MBL fold metallo-hydrolase [Vibrio sp. CyArs1]|uniref:MBL fold metallo-hydrolase n=1 Tax=Vibrio sp. CyArs1 TaxID=2682577 RepID=UPI001F05A762|nr:MBL fold metallo-hydrolase [Vibrio sp. CyArs1]
MMKKLLINLAASLLLISGTALHAEEFKGTPPTMTKVADGVYQYFAGFYSSLVVIGNESVLVTDSANSQRAEGLKVEIAKLTELPVTYVGLSHEHFDHVGGTEVFEDAQVICHETCKDVFSTTAVMPVPAVDIEFSDSLKIDLGGKSVEIFHTVPGDGMATSIYWVPDAKVAFSADMYNYREFIFADTRQDTNFLGVIKILEMIESWKPSYVIDAHMPGNSLTAMTEYVQMLNDLKTAVEGPMRTALESQGPHAVFGLISTLPQQIKLEQYADWKGYDKQFPDFVKRMAIVVFHGG